MRKLLIAVLLALAGPVPSFSQQAQFTAPDCEFAFTYSVVAGVIQAQAAPLGGTRIPASADVSTQAGYDNRFKACVTWTMTYQVDGPGAVSIEIDSAPMSAGVPGTWSIWPSGFVAPGTVLPLTLATQSQVSVFSYFPWVSVILNSATGNGQVTGHVYGWKPAAGQDASSTGTSTVAVTTDPCQSSGQVKSSTFQNITTATTTALVAVSGTTTVYVCEITGTITGTTTATTVLFEQGTGVACAGTPTALTGIYSNGTASTAVFYKLGGGGANVFKTAAANGLCAVSTVGTTPTISATVTYVQR